MKLGDVTLRDIVDYCKNPKTECKDCPYKDICSNIIIDYNFKKALEKEIDD